MHTLWFESLQQARPRDAEHEVEEPRRGGSQRHTVRSHVQRVCLSTVRERHGSFAWTVNHAEQIETRGNAGDACGVVRLGHPEAEADEEEADRHEWEGGEEEVSTAEGIDRVDSRNRKKPVDSAPAERGGEGVDFREVGIEEDGGGVVGDDVDACCEDGNVSILKQRNLKRVA